MQETKTNDLNISLHDGLETQFAGIIPVFRAHCRNRASRQPGSYWIHQGENRQTVNWWFPRDIIVSKTTTMEL